MKDAVAYLNDAIEGVTLAVQKSAERIIKNNRYWIDFKDCCVGPLSIVDGLNFRPSKELNGLGGKLKYTQPYRLWFPPKGAKLYQLSYFSQSSDHGYYWLMRLKDGREFLLRQTNKRLSIVDHFTAYAFKGIMHQFFRNLYGEGCPVEKEINRIARKRRI
jgi:hypothetical protein